MWKRHWLLHQIHSLSFQKTHQVHIQQQLRSLTPKTKLMILLVVAISILLYTCNTRLAGVLKIKWQDQYTNNDVSLVNQKCWKLKLPSSSIHFTWISLFKSSVNHSFLQQSHQWQIISWNPKMNIQRPTEVFFLQVGISPKTWETTPTKTLIHSTMQPMSKAVPFLTWPPEPYQVQASWRHQMNQTWTQVVLTTIISWCYKNFVFVNTTSMCTTVFEA